MQVVLKVQTVKMKKMENEIPIDHDENYLAELALLGFFNDFALIDIGIHDFIREVYFED